MGSIIRRLRQAVRPRSRRQPAYTHALGVGPPLAARRPPRSTWASLFRRQQ